MHAGLVFLFIFVPVSRANYRKFGFYNHDLCSKEDKGKKSLQLGAGAALLTLDNLGLNASHMYSKCSVTIQADQGFGLMVYVEEMNLRTTYSGGGKSSCVDSVQFGRDDLIPFFTMFKSKQLCGNQTGFHYDEPGGKLLVWLNIGARPTNAIHKESNIDKLTIVITAYKKGRVEDSPNYRMCSIGERMVRKEYFCDWRVNCALDREPADERPEICRHTRGSGARGNGPADQPGDWHPPLNLVSITLVLVSLAVLLVLVLLLVARMRRSGFWCYKLETVPECELPEHVSGVARPNAAHPAGAALRLQTNEGHENVYLPLTMYLEPRHDQGPRVVRRSNTTPDTEPPPAYHDLFPAGYKFDPEKREESSLDPLEPATKTHRTESLGETRALPEANVATLGRTQTPVLTNADVTESNVIEAVRSETDQNDT